MKLLPAATTHKRLSDNRARYQAQSAATTGGKLAPLPPRQELPLCLPRPK